jgi:hypothetical protein
MKTSPPPHFAHAPFSGSAEETLRLIATLPAPEGLEDRIENRLEAALRSAPPSGHVLHWPAHIHQDRPWFRVAAAAAIAFVVVGGGWGVYSRVERQQPANVTVSPAPGPAAGGFSNAGAIRTPQTLNGPVVTTPADDSAEKKKTVIAQSEQKKKAATNKRGPAQATKSNEATPAPDPAKN